jgi:NAD(P)-dependent dehydrogenase (short-subunit alcohol dehydrogenase family)
LDLKDSDCRDAAKELSTYALGQCFQRKYGINLTEINVFFKDTNGLQKKEVQVIGIECDVSSEASVQNAYEKVMDTFGRIDSVVASAGALRSTSSRWI